jgi:hypothetical protein
MGLNRGVCPITNKERNVDENMDLKLAEAEPPVEPPATPTTKTTTEPARLIVIEVTGNNIAITRNDVGDLGMVRVLNRLVKALTE